MLAPQFTVTDLLAAARALLPRGRAFRRDPSTTLTAFLTGVAAFCTQFANRAGNLLADAFPTTTVELLPQWEAALGLPDPCQGPAPSLQDRRNQVVARFAGSGGQSVAYFTALALTLGYAITIIQYAPFRFGINHFGDPLYGVAWANAWTVRSPTIMPTFFEFGLNAFGDPLADWGNTVLQCTFAALAPAHTVVQFQYS